MAGSYKFSLKDMLRKFGIVTVMNVSVYEAKRFTSETVAESGANVGDWDAASTLAAQPLFTLDTLKISNINQEGPTKSITGGMNADILLKYGKTFTVEMQDALGRMDVLEHIYGANISKNEQVVSFTDGFPGELTLVGDTFVIDQATGAKQPIKVVLPLFLSDGIFNLSMDAEGDAAVFDLNGSLLAFETASSAGEAAGTEEGSRYFKKGNDNSYYFFVTEEGYTTLKSGFKDLMKEEPSWAGAAA